MRYANTLWAARMRYAIEATRYEQLQSGFLGHHTCQQLFWFTVVPCSALFLVCSWEYSSKFGEGLSHNLFVVG